MNWLTRWFIHNPVAANLLMMLLLAGGLLSFSTLRVESFPQIPPSQLQVTVEYPGATARQVDEGITQRIEEAISSVPGVDKISSESYSGYAKVTVKKKSGKNLDDLYEQVKSKVQTINDFPKKAEQPKVAKDEFTNLATYVMVYGADEVTLQQSARRVEKALKLHNQISQVTNLGKRKSELVINVNPSDLKKYGLSLENISEQLQTWSLEYPAGELKTARGKVYLRGDFQANTVESLQQVPIITHSHGSITLADIASVQRTYENSDTIVRFQGASAISLLVSTSQKDHLLKVSKAVKETIKQIKPQLPENIRVDTMADMAPYIEEQIGLLSTNAWQGLLIVLLLLGLFLNLRLAFWVALGIPISLAGTLLLMGPLNYSINDITLFGMILVLGVLVDDAVVVGESIHEARSRYTDPKIAAEKGVNAVSVATVFGVLTTIAAFSPMLWIDNELAKVLSGFSAIVILALIFSMIESKFILPSHLSYQVETRKSPEQINSVTSILKKGFSNVRSYCLGMLEKANKNLYKPILNHCLKEKTAVFILFFTFMISAYQLMDQGLIRSVFFPDIPGRYITAKAEMLQSAPESLTQNNAAILERSLMSVNSALKAEFKLEHDVIARQLSVVESNQSIEIVAELSNEAVSSIPANHLLKMWQQETGVLEGTHSLQFSAAESMTGGTYIHISAPDRTLAKQVAVDLKKQLKLLPGVEDIYDDGQEGDRQIQFKVNELGKQLGVTQNQIAFIVSGAYSGVDAQKHLLFGEEIQTRIRYQSDYRKTEEQLLNTDIQLTDQHTVSLQEIADVSYFKEPPVIHRKNRQEVVTLYWHQDKSVNSPEAVWAELKAESVPLLQQKYPGVIISAGGEFEELGEVQAGFKKALVLTLLLIYVLLAIPLKSYWQPLIIMSIIPFGYAGAIYGHGLLGIPVSILSLFGMMAMTGVVINDSLVLMTRFNQNLSQGMQVSEALLDAGTSRFKAIFLTTVTTVCGLLPLLFETSEQAQYLKPAAISLVFGELFATPITLILIPILLALGKYKFKPIHKLTGDAHGPATS